MVWITLRAVRRLKANKVFCFWTRQEDWTRYWVLIDDIAKSVKTFMLHYHPKNFTSRAYGILISQILHRLPHIQNFSLHSLGTESKGGGSLHFSKMRKGFRSAIQAQALCRFSNLITLTLCSIKGFPITAPAACPNLGCLHLSNAALDVNSILCTFHDRQLYVPVRPNRWDIKPAALLPGFLKDWRAQVTSPTIYFLLTIQKSPNDEFILPSRDRELCMGQQASGLTKPYETRSCQLQGR